jgi:hypothetical protein
VNGQPAATPATNNLMLSGLLVKRSPLFVSLLLLGGCGSLDASRPETEDDYPEAVATAQANGVEAYWLGPSFEAAPLQFDTIESVYPQGAAGVSARGLQLKYLAIREDTADQYTVRAALDLKTFLPDEWREVESAVRQPKSGLRLTWEPVSVGGSAASIAGVSLDGIENGWLLIVPRGQSVVYATVASSISDGGTEANPLMDREVFLSVMENLRPYPE